MSIRMLMFSLMLICNLILFISNPNSYLLLIPTVVSIGFLIGEIRFQRNWNKQQQEITKQEAERSGN